MTHMNSIKLQLKTVEISFTLRAMFFLLENKMLKYQKNVSVYIIVCIFVFI